MKKFDLKVFLLLFFVACANIANAAEFQTPAQQRNFVLPTTYSELKPFVKELAEESPMLRYEVIGRSVEGREILVLKAGDEDQPERGEKLRVLIFSQQHGNEQSSKEAALLMLAEIANGRHQNWFRELEIWIVPQVNPDGSEVNQRRNAANLDLNRDHLLLQSPEINALHALFHKYMPHVTIDVHEYQPFTPSWAEFGGFKNFDVQVGILTNPNVTKKIRRYSNEIALPYIEKRLFEKGYSFHNYLIGPVPTEGLTRHSTININDGRQGLGILGGMSFIYEGINGRDGFADNLERRTNSQTLALVALIDLVAGDARRIRRMTEKSRNELIKGGLKRVAIRKEHIKSNEPLLLPLVSSTTGMDTTVAVNNFHPLVNPTLWVDSPEAYLIPSSDSLLVSFLKKHRIRFYESFDDPKNIYAYQIIENRLVQAEAPNNSFPVVEKVKFTGTNLMEEYLLVPLTQLKSHLLVLALEPQSQIGLVQYPIFYYLLDTDRPFPILRVE
ncbi:MAG TPA: M14 family zinc carboxypeptidase [Bacteroidales bacterium]|nr:M14 family zinc carboxypeptidase [Bacteroidales bacterium]